MAWGESILAAWDSATDAARDAAANTAAGAKDAADWGVNQTTKATQWAKEKGVKTGSWIKYKSAKFGITAKRAYDEITDKFSKVAEAAGSMIKCAGKKISHCWNKATNAKPESFTENLKKDEVKTAVDHITSRETSKALSDAAQAKTLRGKAARVGNFLDSRIPLSFQGGHAGKLFDGRKTLAKNFNEGAKRLAARSKTHMLTDAWSAAKGSVSAKTLGISVAVETAFKLHDKGWDVTALEKKDGIEVAFGVISGSTYGAAGAAIGTFIPVPVVGTVVGFIAGVAIGCVIDGFIKAGTVEFLDCITD